MCLQSLALGSSTQEGLAVTSPAGHKAAACSEFPSHDCHPLSLKEGGRMRIKGFRKPKAAMNRRGKMLVHSDQVWPAQYERIKAQGSSKCRQGDYVTAWGTSYCRLIVSRIKMPTF